MDFMVHHPIYPYISRFSGRGRWILCVVADVAEIVGVAMRKWAWPQNFARLFEKTTVSIYKMCLLIKLLYIGIGRHGTREVGVIIPLFHSTIPFHPSIPLNKDTP